MSAGFALGPGERRCSAAMLEEGVDHLEDGALLGGRLASVAKAELLTLHRNAQRLIEPITVVNPYAPLKPLRSAADLEEVLFYESTNITDGDLTPLAALPRLQHISFQNRRQYSHKREKFPLAGHSPSVVLEHG